MLILIIDGGGISYEIALRWLPLNFNDDKSTLVQVMAWCRQATSHPLNQCWPISLSPYGVTRQHWVKTCINKRLSMLLISSAPMPLYLEYTHLLKCKVIPIFGVKKFDFADAESAVWWRHRNVNYRSLSPIGVGLCSTNKSNNVWNLMNFYNHIACWNWNKQLLNIAYSLQISLFSYFSRLFAHPIKIPIFSRKWVIWVR